MKHGVLENKLEERIALSVCLRRLPKRFASSRAVEAICKATTPVKKAPVKTVHKPRKIREKHPLTSESPMKKIENNNTLVFITNIRANKYQLKSTVKKLYEITVSKVDTLIRPDGQMKVYVKLAPDYDALDIAKKIGIT
ncbi:RP-L23Ae [Lepeophtheirus salmonis]|uniref:RP-L23Ae n=1 Tax=Lepeophtheirus salmonis TaxID=72036 RepID=A0A7R8CIQ2_LEPSM|nr:RP-L23Ae [Lepeophtheirus salmonis]CAF2828861.1 RP-L23Ae [Lepeophtheirus salmonis]